MNLPAHYEITALPTLYKKDSKGRVRQWTIQHDTAGRYRTTEGLCEGKQSQSAWTQCVTTNEGKANERTPMVQAEAEAKAKWQRKQEKEGYALAPEDSGKTYVDPMLAHKWQDYGDEATYPLALQPKFDGFRCLVYLKDGKPYAQSRKGKPFWSVPHILAACAPILAANPELVLDGELYNHALKDDFERISSLVRKQKPTAAELRESASIIQYHVYDCFAPGVDTTFYARNGDLRQRLRLAQDPRLVPVPTHSVDNLRQLEEYEESYVGDGYEGVMARQWSAYYVSGRTKALLKVKRFYDEEFVLLRLEEGKGDRAGLATRAVLRNNNGTGIEFAAGVIGNNAYTARLLKDQARFNGREFTVKFLRRTKDDVPYGAKLKTLRID